MNGFSIILNNNKMRVRFLHPNEKVVICFIDDGENEFRAKSSCNFDEGDVYKEMTGEEYALDRAIEKRNKYYMARLSEAEDKFTDTLVYQNAGLKKHWEIKRKKYAEKLLKKIEKEKQAQYENAQDETPPVEAYEKDSA